MCTTLFNIKISEFFFTLCCCVLHVIIITGCISGYTRHIYSILRHSQLLSISSSSTVVIPSSKKIINVIKFHLLIC
jgi:hypothetical protein